jgi:hypothetical protein
MDVTVFVGYWFGYISFCMLSNAGKVKLIYSEPNYLIQRAQSNNQWSVIARCRSQ